MENRENFILPLFSVPVGVYHFDDYLDNETIIDYILKNTNQPNVHNTSSEDVYILDKPLFAPVKKFIQESLYSYTANAYLFTEDVLDITLSWSNVTRPGESHHVHHHLNSYISGVFYFNDCEGGPITLENPLNQYKQIEHINKTQQHNMFTCWNWSLTPRQNTLILFPSWVRHSVPKCEDNLIRTNIAFNTWFKRGTALGSTRGKTFNTF